MKTQQHNHAALMAQLGPQTWAKFHELAQQFKAQVGDSCGCGDHAVTAMQGWHAAITQSLGKPVSAEHKVALVQFAEFMQEAVEASAPFSRKALKTMFEYLDDLRAAKHLYRDAYISKLQERFDLAYDQARKVYDQWLDLKYHRMSQGFLDFVLSGLGTATGATIGATVAAKVLGGAAVTSPEAAIRVIDKERDKDSKGVHSPAHVEGDQAQVDIGSLLQDLEAALAPGRLGEVDGNTQRVVREAA